MKRVQDLFTFQISDEWLDKVKAIAKSEERSVGAVIRILIKEALEAREEK